MEIMDKDASLKYLAELKREFEELKKRVEEISIGIEELYKKKKFKEVVLWGKVRKEKVRRIKNIAAELEIIDMAFREGVSDGSSRSS